MAYRTMENYLGLGLNASSFLDEDHAEKLEKNTALRLTNTKNLTHYLESKRLDEWATIEMTHKDYLIEKFFLNLRTNQWIKDILEFKEVLVPNHEIKIKKFQQEWFMEQKKDERLCLTDTGMDVFNTIITELLQEI